MLKNVSTTCSNYANCPVIVAHNGCTCRTTWTVVLSRRGRNKTCLHQKLWLSFTFVLCLHTCGYILHPCMCVWMHMYACVCNMCKCVYIRLVLACLGHPASLPQVARYYMYICTILYNRLTRRATYVRNSFTQSLAFVNSLTTSSVAD